jgi:predicted Rossmann fold flavoprotein
MPSYNVLIIGGGAAGLLAAGHAASLGARTIILEKKSIPGRKLAITGKGRCNLTNIAELSEFIKHFGSNGRFLRQAFSHFFSHDLVALLGELGVPVDTERGGRVFPVSEQAGDIVEALVRWAKGYRVQLKTDMPVDRLIIENNKIIGVRLRDKTQYLTDSVIIATGGVSYPLTGSTGDGYRLAESCGHKIIPVRPSLIPLETHSNIAQRMQGLSLKNVSASLWIDGRKKAEEFGEMLFTHFGVSGPIILTLSRLFVDAIRAKKQTTLVIDLKPALDHHKLDERLLRDIDEHGKQKYGVLIKGLLPRLMIPICIEQTGINPDKLAHQISASERKRLRLWLKDFRLEVTGYRPIKEAIITAGGVNVKEIDPKTMQSRFIDGLYFAGEVLDIDGDTGGYNLQAAFSTGWLAGQSAAEKSL